MEKDTWTRGPDMSWSRYFHTCNLVTHENGTQDIIVIGGRVNGGRINGNNCPNGNTIVDVIHLNSQPPSLGNGPNG